jgi:2-polyprenyl-3-methyl-5-hydroxy-6-metoxy-1,4-benzoquinol methylase
VLDVGCGGGILSEELYRIGAHVTGVDASHKNVSPLPQRQRELQVRASSARGLTWRGAQIQVAEAHALAGGLIGEMGGTSSLAYRAATAAALLDEGLQFEVVVCSEVLEHVADVRAMVAQLCALVSPAPARRRPGTRVAPDPRRWPGRGRRGAVPHDNQSHGAVLRPRRRRGGECPRAGAAWHA